MSNEPNCYSYFGLFPGVEKEDCDECEHRELCKNKDENEDEE